MFPRQVLTLFIVVVVVTPAVLAAPQLSQVFSFDADSLNHRIRAIEFEDIDGDGWPEALITDNWSLLLYNIKSDSVLCQFDIDSLASEAGFTFVPIVTGPPKLVLGDVNRDSLPDAVLLWGLPAMAYGAEYGPLVVLVDNLLAADPDLSLIDLAWPADANIGVLQVVDDDNDGYNELTLSADSADISLNPACLHSYTTGVTRTYYSFPDSIAQCQNRLITNRLPLDLVDGATVWAASRYYPSLFWCYGELSFMNEFSELVVLDSSGTILTEVQGERPEVCTGNAAEDTYSLFAPRCAGNIDDRDSYSEILSTDYWRRTCTDTVYGTTEIVYDSWRAEIVLHRVVAADSLEEVWRVDRGFLPLANFHLHSRFPGTFFAINRWFDTVYQYNGRTGGRMRVVDTAPEGLRLWAYPFGESDRLGMGGPDYLVVCDSTTVNIYAVRDVTGVENNPSPAGLPTTLTLGRPYPNPFNPTVTLPIALDEKGHLTVEVYNPLGQKVTTLHDAVTSAGEFDLTWEATGFASGVYLFKATLGDESKTVKAVLLK